jgi:hypothetical protein
MNSVTLNRNIKRTSAGKQFSFLSRGIRDGFRSGTFTAAATCTRPLGMIADRELCTNCRDLCFRSKRKRQQFVILLNEL